VSSIGSFFSYIILIVAPCILISSKSFIYQQMHFISVLKNIKIDNKIYIKTAPTCLDLQPSSGSLHMGVAKVTFIKSVKVHSYGLCGCVAACYIKSMVVCMLCAVCCAESLCTAHSTHTLARPICKLPDDGCRPKPVGAVLI